MIEGSADRRSYVAARLDATRRRIAAGCAAVGRDSSEVTLIVVTKTYPASDVRLLGDLGIGHVGENRDQEAAAKAEECAELGLSWHMIGRMQTNKARSVARWSAMVHSLDRLALVPALDRAAEAAGRVLPCLVQVSLDGDPSRGGVPIEHLPALAAAVAGAPGLELRGIMAVAPVGVDPYRAFAILPALSRQLRHDDDRADIVSAGMSDDLEAALACGATHLRVGSGVLGRRPTLR